MLLEEQLMLMAILQIMNVADKRGTKEVEISVPLKYLGNFGESLDIPLINYEVSLALTWYADCAITSMEKRITTCTNRGDSPKKMQLLRSQTQNCMFE